MPKVRIYKLPLAITALLMLASTAQADEYITASNISCKIHNPYPQPNESATWSGACVDGYAEGEGVVTWFRDGEQHSIVKGVRHLGRLQGKTVIKWVNGTVYVGENNGWYRKGTQIWADGERFTGEWRNDKRTGKGIYQWVSGDWYQGDFVDNEMHGKGMYVWADGAKYIGDWQHDERTGQGNYIWANGDQYAGNFKDGFKNGYGKLTLIKSSPLIQEYEDQGKWVGNHYVVEGVFEGDVLVAPCGIAGAAACDRTEAVKEVGVYKNKQQSINQGRR